MMVKSCVATWTTSRVGQLPPPLLLQSCLMTGCLIYHPLYFLLLHLPKLVLPKFVALVELKHHLSIMTLVSTKGRGKM